jgi:hypothetical protein
MGGKLMNVSKNNDEKENSSMDGGGVVDPWG